MAAVAEGSPPGNLSSASIWLFKLLSVPEKLTSKLSISSNKRPPPPPPVLPISISTPSTVNDNDLHPIIQMMREQELGRAIINLAVPVAAAAVLISSDGKLLVAHIVVVGLMTGCMTIWNGILFRTTFPRIANVLEQVGISLVLLSVHAYVSSFLPKEFSWILWLSGAFCLLPFVLARILREKAIQASGPLV